MKNEPNKLTQTLMQTV